MRRGVGFLLGVLAVLVLAREAAADFQCSVLHICYYEGPAFQFRVVDAETRQPLGDVHALAEWVLYGMHGLNGPLLVRDTVSGPDGKIAFPAWGPLRGPVSGLSLDHSPAITLFKAGYKTFLLQNRGVPLGEDQTTRVRTFDYEGKTIALEPFRGTPEEWVEELKKAAWRGWGRSDNQGLQFRVPYLNRLERVWAERDKLPESYRKPGQTFWHIEREIRFLEEGKR